ncbi:hypothetical protein Pmani_020419 [Petrolisthes manimaculis]|uniref:Uncharacterized protein n=1 Tax=Petrolisthes manimaculis TaxID=1843537 RepID=A0AAE1U6E8_9EUCA|nr:hypothetical protein Pmani_020419 [Petrolisthes manimaculis]
MERDVNLGWVVTRFAAATHLDQVSSKWAFRGLKTEVVPRFLHHQATKTFLQHRPLLTQPTTQTHYNHPNATKCNAI